MGGEREREVDGEGGRQGGKEKITPDKAQSPLFSAPPGCPRRSSR